MEIDKLHEGDCTYFRIYASCPECNDHGRSVPRTFWEHGENPCYGEMYVGDNAMLKCKKCGYTFHVKDWGYSCAVCMRSTANYLKRGSDGPGNIISFVGQMENECGLPWLQKFLTNSAMEEEE